MCDGPVYRLVTGVTGQCVPLLAVLGFKYARGA